MPGGRCVGSSQSTVRPGCDPHHKWRAGTGCPSFIIKRFGEDPGASAAAVYGLRLFGVRTVLIGADLITQQGEPLEHTLRQAIIIHTSDTATVVGLGVSGRLRPKMAIPLALISAVNTALAIAAWAGRGHGDGQ